MKAAVENDGSEYFSPGLEFLFFYDFLPLQFKYKWAQSTLGHFEFNATFFDLLRQNSKELDNLIYGGEGYRGEDIKTVFGDYIFNEITPGMAEKIKQTIEENEVFNDWRFAADKANFLELLNKTKLHEWRLLIIDWG